MDRKITLLLFVTTLSIFDLTLAIKNSINSSTSSLNSNNPKCTPERMATIELGVAKMVGFGEHGRQYPESFEKVKTFCK